MPTLGTDVFLQLAGKSRRMLYPSKVVEVTENTFTVELEENIFSFDAEGEGQALETDQEILIYFNRQRNFLKQAARIDELLKPVDDEFENEDDQCKDHQCKVLVRLEATGEPVSAESRQCYRVSTVVAELSASFGECDDCELVDVSSTGFAVISREEYPVGKVVTASPRYEDLRPTGPVCIQSVQALNDGRFRYGVHCVEKSFQEEVQQLGMELQRLQLRRLAGRT
jgi:hypothetical protein